MTPANLAQRELVHILYRDHHGWLRAWLHSKLGRCASHAADLAHDTFVRVLSARDAAAIRQPRDYLHTIARGLMIDFFRRRALEQAYLDALASRPEPVELAPEARALLLETLLAIDAALDGLGPRTRRIFLMAQIEGLTYVQIGRRLGVSITTVKNHLARALTRCLSLAGQ